MRSANTIFKRQSRPTFARPATLSLLAILTLTAAILLGGCDTGTNTKDTASAGPRKQNPEEGWQIESLMSESGKVKGKLRAPYMLRYQKSDSPYAEFPRSLHVDFFKDSVEPGKPIGDSIIVESRMDAKYGKYLQNQNKVFLRDSVVVKNILKGDTLYCKELWWDQATQKFFTDKPVEIYTKEKILFGTGMEADQNFRWYTITHLTGSSLMNQSGKETK